MKHISVLPILFFLSACVTYTPGFEEPPTWSAVLPSKSNTCTDISGKYHDTSTKYQTDPSNTHSWSHNRSLAGLLFPSLSGVAADHITFHTTNNSTLEITIFNKEKIIYQTTLKKDKDYQCGSHHIVFNGVYSVPTGDGGGFTARNQSLYLGKSQSNSLIASGTINDRGIWLLILPHANTTYYWYNYDSL